MSAIAKILLHLLNLRSLVGWLFPGLGHIVAGNVRRGLWAMTGVMLLFVTGVLVGGIDCIDRTEDTLWFIGQAGCGPITFAVGFANDALLKSGSVGEMIAMPAPMNAPKVFANTYKGLAHANEFGTLLVFLAGLLNVCVMLDAGVREPKSDDTSAGRRAGDPKTRPEGMP